MFSVEQKTINVSPIDSQDDQHSGLQTMRQRFRTSEYNTRWEEKMEAPSWRGDWNRRLNVEWRSRLGDARTELTLTIKQ